MLKKIFFCALIICLNIIFYSFSVYADDPTDTDNDGIPDYWEIHYNLNPNVFDSADDSDGDFLTNLREFFNQTNPNLADTDNDGLPDGDEVHEIGTEQTVYSNVSSGVSNVKAVTNGTNYFVYWDNDSGVYAKILDANGNTVKDTFLVNTFYIRILSSTEVVTDGDNFFAVWGDDNIYGQLYSSTGVKIGGEFQINELPDYQNAARAAFNGTNYCVAWYGYEEIFVGWDPITFTFIMNYYHYIYTRVIDKNGNKVGSEIELLAMFELEGDSKEGLFIDVAASKDNFMVVYQLDFWYEGFAFIVDDSGNIVADKFQVNTVSAGTQLLAEPASNGDNFFVAWTSPLQDGDGKGVFGKIYGRTGNVTATDFQINTYFFDDQQNPVIAVNGEKYFVTWVSDTQDGDYDGVYAQLFDNDGTKTGSEFRVNTATSGYQNNQSLGANGKNYIAAWKSADDGIYFQVFDLAGNKDRDETLIESYSEGSQGTPFVVNNRVEYMVLWTNGIDVSGKIIHLGYGTDPADADTDNDGLKDGYEILYSGTNPFSDDTDNDGLTDYEEIFPLYPQLIVNQNSEYLNTNPDISYNGMNHLAVWKSKSPDGTIYQVKGRIINDYGLTYRDEFVVTLNEGMNELESSFELPSGSYLDLNNPSIGNYIKQACRFTAQDTFPCRNIELKLQKKGNPSGNVFISLYTDGGFAPGTEIAQSENISASSVSASGEWVQFSFSQSQAITAGSVYWIVLQSDYPAGANCVGWEWNNTSVGKNWTFYNGAWANYASYTVGALYKVYSSLSVDLPENQMIPKTVSDGQNYLVVWQSLTINQTELSYGIYGRLINPVGGFMGDSFQINSNTGVLQLNPVAASNGLNYCVMWEYHDNDGAVVKINYQYLNLDGSKNGEEIVFAQNAVNPVICSNGDGYILRYDIQNDTTVKSAHISTNSNTYLYLRDEKGSEDTIAGSFVDGDNQVVAPEVVFSYPLSSLWRNPCSAYYEEKYLVLWQDNPDNDGLDIYAQFIDTQGRLIGDFFKLNSLSNNDQSNVAVSSNESGYLAAWETDAQGLGGKDILVSYVKWGIGTDPFLADTDNDGLTDGDEVLTYGSDPENDDSDNDGLSDGQEVNDYNTLPTVADTDNDGLNDGVEVNQFETNPLNPDSDSDGMNDGDEVYAGMDPADPLSLFSVTEVIYNHQLEPSVKITWTVTDLPNRSYKIYWKSFDGINGWAQIIEPEIINNHDGTNSFIDTDVLLSAQKVYKVIVEFSDN